MAAPPRRFLGFLFRLTEGRFTIDQRTDLYLSATEGAALGWLIDFVCSARADYRDRDGGPQQEESCLTSEAAIEPLVERALVAIRTAAADGSLLRHQDLVYILYRWRDFMDGDPAEVRDWTDSLMNSDDAVVTLARAFTGQSWSMGMGFAGLGDRISMPRSTALITDDIDIVDAAKFRSGLERIRDAGILDNDSLQTVNALLGMWDRRRSGDDD